MFEVGDEFELLAAAVSALDCFAYAVFAASAHDDPNMFPFVTPADRRNATPGRLKGCLVARSTATDEPFLEALDAVYAEPNQPYKWLGGWRNIVVHRATPTTTSYVGGERSGTRVIDQFDEPLCAELAPRILSQLELGLSIVVPAAAYHLHQLRP